MADDRFVIGWAPNPRWSLIVLPTKTTKTAPAVKKPTVAKTAPKAAAKSAATAKTVELKAKRVAKAALEGAKSPARTAGKTPIRRAAPKAAAKPGVVTKTAERKAKRAEKAETWAKTPAKAAAALKTPTAPKSPRTRSHEPLLKAVLAQLDDDKAEEIVTIDLEGRADYADVIVIASGRSARHVASVADHLAERVKADGYGRAIVEGEKTGDWAVIDCGDVVVHLFRPEVRAFYDLEAMWADGAKHVAAS